MKKRNDLKGCNAKVLNETLGYDLVVVDSEGKRLAAIHVFNSANTSAKFKTCLAKAINAASKDITA